MKICPTCRTTYHEAAPVCPADGASLLDLQDDDARCGTLVDDRFLILSRLGEGGMGTVYRAWQFSTERLVALKLLISAFTDNKTAVERFMREARVTAGLNSPHVVRVYDFGQLADGTAYMAMELLDGVPLDRLVDAPMAPARAIELVRQICIALEEAHGQGLVHRDLKPGNIMVRQLADGGDFAQVLDFGIAKLLDETRTALTAEHQNPGTPAYMSPEQARNEAVGPPTDLYALSVIFFEMLVGERPFTGSSAMSVLLQHVQATPPSLKARLPDLPQVEALDAVLQRGLAKRPDVRYPTAAALRTELERLKSGQAPEAPSTPIVPPEKPKRGFGFNLQALGCSVQLAVAVGALALFVLPAMRDGSDRFEGGGAPAVATEVAGGEARGAEASRFDPPAADGDRAEAEKKAEEPGAADGVGRSDTVGGPERAAKAKVRASGGAPAASTALFGGVTDDRQPIPPPPALPPEAAAPASAVGDAPDPLPAPVLDADESPPKDRAARDDEGGGGPDEARAASKAPPRPIGAERKRRAAVEAPSGSATVAAVAGDASVAEVRRGLLALQPALRGQCGPGRWPLELLVGLDGRVQRVKITQPGRAADAKARCALEVIRDARLPRPAKPLPLILTL